MRYRKILVLSLVLCCFFYSIAYAADVEKIKKQYIRSEVIDEVSKKYYYVVLSNQSNNDILLYFIKDSDINFKVEFDKWGNSLLLVNSSKGFRHSAFSSSAIEPFKQVKIEAIDQKFLSGTSLSSSDVFKRQFHTFDCTNGSYYVLDTNIAALKTYSLFYQDDKAIPSLPTDADTSSKSNKDYSPFLKDIIELLKNNKVFDYNPILNAIFNSVKNIENKNADIYNILIKIKELLESINKKFDITEIIANQEEIIDLIKEVLTSMTTLDRDDDHPDHYAILVAVNDIKSKFSYFELLKKLDNLDVLNNLKFNDQNIVNAILSTAQKTQDSIDFNVGAFNNNLSNIAGALDRISGMFTPTGDGNTPPIVNKINIEMKANFDELKKILEEILAKMGAKQNLDEVVNSLKKIIELIEKLIGNQKDFEDSISNMKNAYKKMTDTNITDFGKSVGDSFSNMSKGMGDGDLPKLSAQIIPGEEPMTFFSLDSWTDLVGIIRELLLAILYISTFIYFIRILIPKLKI